MNDGSTGDKCFMPKLSGAAIRNSPFASALPSPILSSEISTLSKIFLTSSRYCSPASVRFIFLVVRFSNLTPKADYRVLMRRLTVAALVLNLSAARLKLPASTTA